MPVYEFLCRDCDARYDDLLTMDQATQEQECPSCTSGDVVKLYSPFSTRVSSAGGAVQVDGCLPGPAGTARGGGCCGGGCGGCG